MVLNESDQVEVIDEQGLHFATFCVPVGGTYEDMIVNAANYVIWLNQQREKCEEKDQAQV